jgi:hypothetical protein
MMASDLAKTQQARRGTVEGYLGLLVAAVCLAFPFVFPHRPLLVTLIVALGLSSLGLLFSSWGIRFGRGGGRIAAWISFVLLLYFTVTFVLISLNHGGVGPSGNAE